MARQNYFIGGIVGPITKAIGGSIISTILGGFGGGEQAARGGGSDSAMAFLKNIRKVCPKKSRKKLKKDYTMLVCTARKNLCQ